jgi:hypothetical protein
MAEYSREHARRMSRSDAWAVRAERRRLRFEANSERAAAASAARRVAARRIAAARAKVMEAKKKKEEEEKAAEEKRAATRRRVELERWGASWPATAPW